MAVIPKDWLPNVGMQRIVCHWTAGGHRASDVDKAHYHLLVEGDGTLVRGTYSIASNVSIRRGRGYAAHTLGCNTGSIGISCCCMLNAREAPFDPGPFPMTEVQWERMAQAVAELCVAYDLPPRPDKVLGHGEVERILGIRQRAKWDPLKLPWLPRLGLFEVGDLFRSRVQAILEAMPGETPAPPEEPPLELRAVKIREHTFEDAVMENASAFVKAKTVAQAFGLRYDDDDAFTLDVTLPDGKRYTVPYTVFDREVYADVYDLARIFDLEMSWSPRTKTITLT